MGSICFVTAILSEVNSVWLDGEVVVADQSLEARKCPTLLREKEGKLKVRQSKKQGSLLFWNLARSHMQLPISNPPTDCQW